MSNLEQNEVLIGRISHFFNHLNVGIIELTAALQVGNKIHIKGHTTDFVEVVQSMQKEHTDIKEAQSGDSIGIKVTEHVREGDEVYKVV